MPPATSRLDLRRRPAAAAFAVYLALSFVFFGLRLLLEPGRQYIGSYDDPQIPIWSFAWWPHALAARREPVLHALRLVAGGRQPRVGQLGPDRLAIVFAPLTLLVGPIASYNVAAILMPGRLGLDRVPALPPPHGASCGPRFVGGYLFGFSSYMLGQHDRAAAADCGFLIPLLALLVLRYLDGELGTRRLDAAGSGCSLGCSCCSRSELAFTLTLCCSAIALVLALRARSRRCGSGSSRCCLPLARRVRDRRRRRPRRCSTTR